MTKKHKIIASGGVVLRRNQGKQEVLLIHRPSYDDWTLPKGKGRPDELHPETAVREIFEETGVRARLGLRLPSTTYEVSKGRKVGHFWRASVAGRKKFRPNKEVDRIRWVDVEKADKLLTFPDEAALVRTAVETPESTALLLVRHGKAMARKFWSGSDQKRQLSGRGREQAEALVGLLAAFGVGRLVSSSSTRCTATLKPYAKHAGLKVEGLELLTEEYGDDHPDEVSEFMSGLRAGLVTPTAVCGHRPVLPPMFRGLGTEPRPMVVGESIAFHFDADGRLLARDVFKPTA